MSMDVFDLYAKIGLDTSEYDKGLSTAGAKLKGLGDSIEKGVGNAVKGIGVAMAGATAAVGAFTTAAVQTGLSFDASMSNVKAISGATEEEFDKLTAKAEEMGAKTKYTATEMADAMGYMAMAGWKTEDMLAGLEGITNLATASGSDLATTSDIVTDALTAFGLSAEDASHFADVLATTSTNANTNVQLMGETFKYVAPVAGSLGYSIEDVSLAIGLMANSGIKASTAGTSLRGLFTRLAKQPKEAAAAMDALGISMEDGEGNMLSFRELLKNIRDGFNNDLKVPVEEATAMFADLDAQLENGELTQKQYDKEVENLTKRVYGATGALKAQYGAMLAGTNGMSGLLALVNSSDEDFDKLADAIDHCNGSTADMAKIMGDNLQGNLAILKSSFEALQISISRKVTPAVSDFVKLGAQELSLFADAFRDGGIDTLSDAVVKALTVDLPKLIKEKFAKGKHDILYSLFSTASDGFARFVKGFSTAYSNLSEKLSEFSKSQKFMDFLTRLREISEKMTAERIATLLTGIGEGLLRIAEAVIDFVNSDSVIKFFDAIAAWIDKKGVEGIADTITDIADALVKIWAAGKVAGVVMSIGNAFLFLGGAIRDLKELKSIGNVLGGIGKAGGNLAGLSSALSAVPTLLTSDISLLGAATATEVGLTIGTSIAGGIAAAIAGYNGGKWGAWLIATLAGDIETAELYKNFNLAEGIKSLFNPDENVLDNLKDLFDGAVDMFTDFANNPVIATLSNLALGGFGIVAGIVKAGETIKTGLDGIEGNIGSFTEHVKGAATEAFETTTDALHLWGEDIYNGFLALGEYESEILTPLWENIKTGFIETIETTGEAFKLWGEDIYNGFLALAGYQDEIIAPFLERFKTEWNTMCEDTKGAFALWGEDIYNGFLALADHTDEVLEDIKAKIKGALDWVKENIKLPEISIDGEFDLKHGKVPKINVDWYSKAMDNAMVLNSPTIFGASGGRLLGGGEAGSEVVAGTGTLMNMIRGAVGGQNLTVILELDKTQLGRVVYKLNNEETQRVGVRLANV